MAMSPDTMIRLADESRRGQEAKNVITAPVYSDAMKALKAEIIDKWAACPARDTEGREWLWNHYQTALRFESILQSIMETGKMADITLRQESVVEQAAHKVANLWR